eukprot:2861694-Prorocentrum_lima.AAC.1
MTSSLVGSEMCIRDSGMVRYGIVWSGPYATVWHGTVRYGAQRYGIAVSYTDRTLPTICSV